MEKTRIFNPKPIVAPGRYMPLYPKTMTEQKLKEYFEDKLTAEELSIDLYNSQKQTSYDVTSVYIDSIEDGEFEIKKEHLIKLCNDAILGKLSLIDLNTIGFALSGSDFFNWNGSTEDGKLISDVILEWDSPEIGYDITIKNILLWKEYLISGKYRLDKNELKQKFRSKGKYKILYQEIDEILWNDWDPIGVNDIAPRDEYQSYTPTIMNLKIKGVDKQTIAEKLYEIETTTIGVTGNIEHCLKVAEKIISLKV
ncbi:hypothetical protein ACMDB5_10480 [Flavobacterium sp. W1B]|uniref:hypothetical protein n=1 Tax=Flavobacterium sp. W1B TaxID=3394146 RepID=UPI0039BD5CD1